MGIEPEEVLIKHRIPATFRPEETGAEAQVEQQHDRATSEGWQADQLQGLRGPGGPHKHRHAEEAHPGGTHPDDRGHEIDCAHD